MRHEQGNPPRDASGSGADLSFAAFSFTHAECGEGVIELRLGEGLLLGWCSSCAALETFYSPDE
jgi:hypothetical protein